MPNEENITSPCILLAYGRVGSTLLLDVFRRHSNIHAIGETVQLIFNTWLDKERELSNSDWTLPDDQINFQCSKSVHDTFLRIFHDDRPHWFQKPIGAPNAFYYKFGEFENDDWQKLAEWYWTVMGNAFPNAKYFTVLRHPFDIILSAKKKWNTPEERTWRNLALVSSLIVHPMSKVDFAISYDELVEKPEETLQELFSYLQLEFEPQSLQAFSTLHLASPGRLLKSGEVPTWKQDWDSLDLSCATPYLEQIEKLFNHYKKSFHLPHEQRDRVNLSSKLSKGIIPKDEQSGNIEKIKLGYIEKIHHAMRYGDDLRTYCLDLENRLRKLEEKIQYLEKGNLFNLTQQIESHRSGVKKDKVFSLLNDFAQRAILAGNPDQSAIWNVKIDQVEERAIFLHPPAMIGLTVRDDRQAYLSSAVALHPQVWDNPQLGGCIFSITVDDRVHYQIGLDPLHNTEDRGWHEFILKIPAQPFGIHQIIFECRALKGQNDFCWALWREPLWEFIDLEDMQ